MSIIKDIVGGVVSPVTNYLGKREETKQTGQSLEAKIATAKIDSDTQITLSDKEWELIGKRAEGGTWKDEYITVSVVSIFNLIVLGGLASAFGYGQVLEGVNLAIDSLNNLEGNMADILKVTIYAGLGIYAVKKVL
jgi:hypothetical protein